MAGKNIDSKWAQFYILKFDKEIEIRQSSRTLLDQNGPKHKKVLRGTLLEPISPWQEPKSRQKGNGKLIRVRCLETKYEMECASTEIARITRQEKDLLSAIPTANDRYTTYFKPEHLANALALKKGSRVNVYAKVDSMKQALPGTVRYIGEVPGPTRGKLFGIELENRVGCGTSDGEFGKERFFQCDRDNGLFVAVNKLKFDVGDSPHGSENQSATVSGSRRPSAADYRQSFVESDLKKNMEVYVCSKKGSKEEWVKGKIIYMGKPPGESITYVGVEMEKPRITPWDGTFKSHRLCTPLKQFYSELLQINDVVPANVLDESGGPSSMTASSAKTGATAKPLTVTGIASKTKTSMKRTLSSNPGANKNRGSVLKAPGYAAKHDGSDATGSRLSDNRALPSLPGSKDTGGCSGSAGGRGADENLKFQQQLLDKAGKNKDGGGMNNTLTAKEGRGKKLTKPNFLSKLSSFGSGGNKDTNSVQAGISFSAVVSGRVAMMDVASGGVQSDHVADLPPVSAHLLEQICSQVDAQWAYFGSNLRIEQSQIEKIAGKYQHTADRVVKILMYWWRDARKHHEAMQTLAYVLSELKLDKLAGDILTEHFSSTVSEGKMDNEMLDHVARETAKDWQRLAHHLGLEDDLIKQLATATNIYKDSDRAKEMLKVWDTEISIVCEKSSLLVRACRNSEFADLANELEQGLDTDTLNRISRMLDKTKWRLFGETLGFANEALDTLEKSGHKANLKIYTMLGAWRNTQPFNCDKILAISTALSTCEQDQLAWEICRGLDDDILHDLAMKLEGDWRRLAEWLKLRPNDIQKLETDYPSPAKRTYLVLVTWRKRQHASCDLLGELTKVLMANDYRDIAKGLVDGLHDEILDKVASLVGDEWETLGACLGFSQYDIDAIKDANSLEPVRIYIMLCQWRYRQHYTSDRLQTLIDGLVGCGLKSIGEAILDMMGVAIRNSGNDNAPQLGPNEVSDDQIEYIAKEVGIQWRMLALDLRFQVQEIQAIEDKSTDVNKQCSEMLLVWNRRLPPGFDGKSELIKALDKCNQHELVVKVLGPQADFTMVTGRSVRMETDQNGFNKDTNTTGMLTNTPNDNLSLNESQMFELAVNIGVRWKLVAYDLGFSSQEVQDIESQNDEKGNQAFNMLQNWKEKLTPNDDGRKKLEHALSKGGYKDLILKVFYNHEGTQSRPSEPAEISPYVSKELLIDISKEVDFNTLVNALHLGSGDVDSLKFNYTRIDQRCYQALDTWNRRGPSCKRRLSELDYVLRNMNRTDLIATTREANPRRISESDSEIGELRTDSTATAAPPPIYSRVYHRIPDASEQIDQLTSLSTYGVVEPAKEAMENMEISMVISSSDNPHGLEVNSMVEIPGKKGKLYGVIRWMGHEARLGPMAGVELEDKLEGAGTDGVLLGKRYFICDPNRALFVKLMSVKPDSRFPSQIETFTKRSRLTSDDFGGFKSPYVKGYIQPPTKLAPHFVGRRKGIQGDQNSCYLDTTLYSMYAYSNIFDAILKRQQQPNDLKEFEGVQTTLREHIVNPLRSYGFVRADRVIDLRESLDKLGTTKGLTSEEKDPEEFLHTLLQEVTKTEPFLHIRHGDHVEKSYHYQIFMEKNESYSLPTVEQLLHYSFLHSDLKLTQPPPCLIMQMPRFGKDYRMYNRILPSLYLDISDLLEGYPRICTMCGQLAEYECRDCSGQLSAVTEAINSYCEDCLKIVHKNRPNHKPKDLELSKQFLRTMHIAKENGWSEDRIHTQILMPRKMMELFAVVCIETSHYVAFVKAGTGPDAEWVFFDSMADREGDQQGYNIPEITHLRDFKQWLDSGPSLLQKEDKELPSQLRRLLSDGYMCMYQDPSVVTKHLKTYPTVTNIDEVMRNLEEIGESATKVDVSSTGASGYSREGAVIGGEAVAVGRDMSTSSAMTGGVTTQGAMGSNYTRYQAPESDYASRSSSKSAVPSPASAYTTQYGPSRGGSGKAMANAAACYRNYSDALQNSPDRGLPNSAVSSTASAYTAQIGPSRGSSGKAFTNATCYNYSDTLQDSSNKSVPNSAMYPHASTSETTQYTARGTSNNTLTQHDLSTKALSDHSRSTALLKRQQQISPAYRQHVGLPPDDPGMDDIIESDPTYTLPLNSDADIYSKSPSTAQNDRYSKYDNYTPVSQTNITAAAVHVSAPPKPERHRGVGCSTRSEKPVTDYTPPTARNGISTFIVGRESLNGTSSSSAKDLSLIHPPNEDEDELMTMLGGLAANQNLT